MNDSSSTKAVHRRYKRDLWIALVLYTACVFGGSYGVRYLDWPHWAVIAASLAPLVPALMMLRAYATFLRDIDEFQRRVHTDAILISAAIVGFGTFAYGFLEEWANFPHLSLIWILPALIGIWGLAACIIRLRYK